MQDQSFTKHVLKEPLTQTRPKEGPNPTSRCWALTLPGLAQAKAPNHPPPSRGSAQQTAEPSGYNQGPHPRSVPRAAQPSGPQLRSSRSHLADGTGARRALTPQITPLIHTERSTRRPSTPESAHNFPHKLLRDLRAQLPAPLTCGTQSHKLSSRGPAAPGRTAAPSPSPPNPGRALRTPTPPSRPRTSAAPLDAFFPLFMYFFPLSLLPFPSPLRQK